MRWTGSRKVSTSVEFYILGHNHVSCGVTERGRVVLLKSFCWVVLLRSLQWSTLPKKSGSDLKDPWTLNCSSKKLTRECQRRDCSGNIKSFTRTVVNLRNNTMSCWVSLPQSFVYTRADSDTTFLVRREKGVHDKLPYSRFLPLTGKKRGREFCLQLLERV